MINNQGEQPFYCFTSFHTPTRSHFILKSKETTALLLYIISLPQIPILHAKSKETTVLFFNSQFQKLFFKGYE